MRTGTLRVWIQLPDQYRYDFECSTVFEGDAQAWYGVVLNGPKGWDKNRYGVQELSPRLHGRVKGGMRLKPEWSANVALLLDRQYRVTTKGETMVAGRVVVGVELFRKGEPPVRLDFDKETCQLLKSIRTRDDGSKAVPTYEDYREVESLRVPHKWTFRTDGNVDHEANVEGVGPVRLKGGVQPQERTYELVELKFVDKLDAKLFGKP
jgi:hypothetical protein